MPYLQMQGNKTADSLRTACLSYFYQLFFSNFLNAPIVSS